MKAVKIILYLVIVIVIALCATGLTIFLKLAPQIPRLPDDLRLLASSPPTEIYSRDGELMKRIGGRTYIPLERISPYFLQAVVAIEDKRFYSHHGVDHLALIRAVWLNIKDPGGAPGGSTITQQLAKNLFFSFKRSWKRKLLEGLAAFAIEDRFTKDQILEAYVNLVDFGRFAYGVERASQTYFGKSAKDIELHEAALLAGLPNSPSFLNPVTHLERAKARQKKVLNRMAATGVIDPSLVDSIFAVPLDIVMHLPVAEQGSFPIDYAIESARRHVGHELVSYGGIRIITSIDPMLQQYTEMVLSKGLDELEAQLAPIDSGDTARLEGALVAIEISTGRIVAMLGGRNYRQNSYNRAVYSHRQPGSSFKPVIYLTALDRLGMNAATVLEDKPVVLETEDHQKWSPTNFDDVFRGPVTLKYALMKSINTISAQLIDQVTPTEAVRTAKLLGIQTPLKSYLSLALGGQGVTPLEMTNVYSTLARSGVAREPFIVQRIEGIGADLLFEKLSAGETRFDPETVFLLLDMLTGVIEDGTGVIVRQRGFKGAAVGKTGTTNDFRDAWFCGATPSLAVAVWVGYDDNRQLKRKSGGGVTGSFGAAPIWAEFMIRATAGEPVYEFPRPPGIDYYYIEPTTGQIDVESHDGWIRAAFRDEDAQSLLMEQQVKAESDTLAEVPEP